MNKKRNPDYINLLHKIRNADKPERLERLRQVVIRFHKDNKEDGGQLLVEFIQREEQLNPEAQRVPNESFF